MMRDSCAYIESVIACTGRGSCVELRRALVETAFARVAYPTFTDGQAPAHAEEMNVFYRALAEAVTGYAAALNESRDGGTRFLTADYRTESSGARITVFYTLTLRRRGRTAARKQMVHVWESGALVPLRKHAEKKRRSPGGG